MKNASRLVSSFLIVFGCALTASAHAARGADTKAEARQSTEEMSPQAQYKIAQKEASAAYRDAQADCKKMSKSERTACLKEARSNYQADLSQAKKALSSGK